MKSYQFTKIYKRFYREKEKKHSYWSQREKKNWEMLDFVL